MKNNRGFRAFSLIELSIVILIIGILIAGVTQSSRIIAQSRLNTARTLTQSSPVSSIKNLSLWIESTSEKSFDDAETEADSAISTWYDINPQTSLPANFTGTSTTRPLYKLSTLNNLPTALFDGTDDFMQTTGFANITTASTVFVVIKTGTIAGEMPIFSRMIADDTGTNLQVNVNSTDWKYCDGAGAQNCYTATATVADDTSYVLSVVYTANATNGIRAYQNGTAILTTDTTDAPDSAVTTNLFVGKSGLTSPTFFGGYVGEIIVYDRALKEEERTAIQSYLGKKWGITIS